MVVPKNKGLNRDTASGDLDSIHERLDRLEQQVATLEASPAQGIEDRLAMVVFSGDLDKSIAAFIIATGAAAMGFEVSMFFTFWGINIIKKYRKYEGKNILEKGFTAMMPVNSNALPLTQMNYFGIGAKLIRKVMKDNGVSSLEDLITVAKELDVRLVACDMSQELLGISDNELMDGLDHGDVATFLADSSRAKATIFI
ncbi:MAG: DsrE/DsrF/DrsH-like family protein [Gammaproteobacteria bacterium]|nr:DsrE/DsrF/DrsH-like family protein [Gammaproteobacteria bacterium]